MTAHTAPVRAVPSADVAMSLQRARDLQDAYRFHVEHCKAAEFGRECYSCRTLDLNANAAWWQAERAQEVGAR